MANQPEALTTLFDQQAENYLARDIEGMLACYAPDAELLFWSSENVVCTSRSTLRIWYESLFNQFDIQSVQYRIESCWEANGLIACCSIWQFETMLKQGNTAIEQQSLRATHVLHKSEQAWKIVHLHASHH